MQVNKMAKDYTKRKAYYHNIPCWYNPVNDELRGRNWFYERLVGIALWIDTDIIKVDEFCIEMEKDKDFE